MASPSDARDSGLRTAGVVVGVLGLSVFLFGVGGLATLPPEPRMPNSGDEFMSGKISIGDVGRRNDDWFAKSRARGEQQMGALAMCAFGFFIAFVGGSIFIRSSRRLRGIAYAGTEYEYEAIARGMKRGLASGADGEAEDDAADAEARLEKLQRLHRQGLITDAEYEAKRAAVLARI